MDSAITSKRVLPRKLYPKLLYAYFLRKKGTWQETAERLTALNCSNSLWFYFNQAIISTSCSAM